MLARLCWCPGEPRQGSSGKACRACLHVCRRDCGWIRQLGSYRGRHPDRRSSQMVKHRDYTHDPFGRMNPGSRPPHSHFGTPPQLFSLFPLLYYKIYIKLHLYHNKKNQNASSRSQQSPVPTLPHPQLLCSPRFCPQPVSFHRSDEYSFHPPQSIHRFTRKTRFF
jgi:hypothetical protein